LASANAIATCSTRSPVEDFEGACADLRHDMAVHRAAVERDEAGRERVSHGYATAPQYRALA
jgi:hypothetical protein